MIQELLFGGSSPSTTTTSSCTYSAVGERKSLINNNGGIIGDAKAAASSKGPSERSLNDGNKYELEKNLRCPRCDSYNTKFCYYNNYNLNQPRHFCKTCRRYWTKGGTQRNIPFGGGSRKNKTLNISVLPTSFKSFPAGKPKCSYSSTADGLLKAGLGNIGLFDPQESSLHHPVVFGSSPAQPQISHLLASLRSPQSPNPSNFSHQFSSPPGLDYPCSSFLRNYNQTLLKIHHQQSDVAHQLGVPDRNSGVHELYQKLKMFTNSNTNSYNSSSNDHSHPHVILGNGVSASSSPTSTRAVLESAPVAVGGGSDSGLLNIPEAAYSIWAANGHPCFF